MRLMTSSLHFHPSHSYGWQTQPETVRIDKGDTILFLAANLQDTKSNQKHTTLALSSLSDQK